MKSNWVVDGCQMLLGKENGGYGCSTAAENDWCFFIQGYWVNLMLGKLATIRCGGWAGTKVICWISSMWFRNGKMILYYKNIKVLIWSEIVAVWWQINTFILLIVYLFILYILCVYTYLHMCVCMCMSGGVCHTADVWVDRVVEAKLLSVDVSASWVTIR